MFLVAAYNRHIRAIVVCLAAYEALGILGLTAAQGFAPVQSCTSALSSFAGIVCSGDFNTGTVVHCMLDEHFQAGLVCVEWQFIEAGRCPQSIYNGIGDFPCIGHELCPNGTYKSYEVNKYPACLNSSLYNNESTTAQADATEQSNDCADESTTRSTTGTDTTTKSTVPTDSTCDLISESSKQPMSCAVPVTIAVTCVVVLTWICLLVLEHYTRKSVLEVIRGCLKKGTCNHSTTENVQVSNEETEPSVQSHFMTTPPSRAVAEQSQQV